MLHIKDIGWLPPNPSPPTAADISREGDGEIENPLLDPAARRKLPLAMGSKGAGGSGKGYPLLREAQYDLHNLNSPNRMLSREERRQKKIQELLDYGFPKRLLIERYDNLKPNQGPVVDALNDEGAGLITTWAWKRIDFFHFMVFGNGTRQAEGEMRAIADDIKRIKKRLDQIFTLVRLAEGEPVVAPPFFENFQPPTPPSKGKGKLRK